MPKRGNGEGNVYRRKDGRWAARYTVTIDGKNERRWIYAATRDEVSRRLRDALAARDAGDVVADPSQTVATFLEGRLDSIKPTLRGRSWERYEEHVRLYLTPELGRLRLAGQLGPGQVQRLYSRLLARGLSASTVRRVHAALHRALAQALRWRLVTANVADLVDPPQVRRKEMTALTSPQVRAFLDAADGERLGALFAVAVTAGLRRGELLALRWADVDLDGGAVRVVGSLARTRGQGVAITNPKTTRSRRRVELGETAVEALRRHRASQAAERLAAGPWWEESDLVFTNRRGDFLGVKEVYDAYHRVLDRAELPRVRFHDLRHTAATLMLGRGVHPKVASEMLGHSTIAITLDLYSHVTPTLQRDAARAVDIALREARPDGQ